MNEKNQEKQQSLLRFFCVIAVLTALLLILFFVSLKAGYTELGMPQIFAVLMGKGTREQNLIVFQFRLIRIVLAILVGAGLAVSGTVFQTISKNALASPDLLGVNAGAGIAVLLVTFFEPEDKALGILALPFAALFGALVTALLIYKLANRRGAPLSPLRLVLVGVSVTSGIHALDMILTVRLSPERYNTVNTWLIGSVYGNRWAHVLVLLPWLAIIPLFIYRAGRLNLLHLSDGVAIGLGSELGRNRLAALLLATALAAACVAVGGTIGFVGLVCPHLAKSLVGPNHARSIPAAALTGAALLLAADLVARTIVAPREMLLGIVVSLIGAPYFLYILMTSKK
ncbi:MAG: iron ABC transporter permease [Eubacteriales bacterium]|nr:iron ABC transporter permease [Eubacteriales bacterium]